MKHTYYICGFNGFAQFSTLSGKEVEERSTYVGHNYHSHQLEGYNKDEPSEPSETETSNLSPSDNQYSDAALILPVKVNFTNKFSFGWSFVCIYDKEGTVTYGFSQSEDNKIDKTCFNLNMKKCFGSLDNFLVEETLVKLEQADCAKSFDPLPISSFENTFKTSVNCSAFAVMENGNIFEITAADQKSCLDADGDKDYQLVQYKISNKLEIKSVSCGKEHTLALSNTGKVFSFGLGSRGQLGIGSLENHENPCLIEALQMVEIVTVSAGGWHSLALSSSGDLYSWGWNESGQLGVGCSDDENSLHEPCTRPTDRYCQKDGPCHRPMFCYLPQLVDFEEDVEVFAMSCGSRHSAAVTKHGIFTWGWNAYGQLGHGDKIDRHHPQKIETLDLEQVQAEVLCNAWNTIIRLTIN